MIKDLVESCDKIKELHQKKAADYASPDNPFSNFDVSAYISGLFSNPRDKVYAVLIGIKLARLANLLSSNREPNNESIDDSFLDLATYTLIWKADVLDKAKPKLTNKTTSTYYSCSYCDSKIDNGIGGVITEDGYFCSSEHARIYKANKSPLLVLEEKK